MNNAKTTSLLLGGKDLIFETGALARQADGSVLVRFGDQVILVTATMGKEKESADFFPLVVDFEPRYYSAGRFRHSKVSKREGKKGDRDVVISRVTDRPLRPMFPKGLRNEVQIIGTQLQTDEQNHPASLFISAASLAIQLAGLPFERSVSAVQVGMDENGDFITNPTFEQVDATGFDFIVAGTEDAIMMVEAGANLVDNEKALAALVYAHEEIKKICRMQDAFLKLFEIEKQIGTIAQETETHAAAEKAVLTHLSESDFDAVFGETKKEVKTKLHALEEKLMIACAEDLTAGTILQKELLMVFEKRFAKNMRKRIFETGKRVDGRTIETVRSLSASAGIFNRVHGSGLFQRGETQVLSMLTLGGPDDEKYVDSTDRGEFRKRYIHHYNFPPFSVGEVQPLRGPGRREIGHGALAERALVPVLPNEKSGWQYTVRVVSEVLSCNGSSSMASVCGSTLALMDAGVPIKTPIAGVAMGLLMNDETGDYRILTDIQGLEDFDGDMDFKVAGDEERITGLQLDIKIKGLKLELLADALERAKVARKQILGVMKSAISEPRKAMSPYAPLIEVIKIPEDKIREVIGKGGEVIQKMCSEFKVGINIEDDGTVVITGKSDGIAATLKVIGAITYIPKIGDIFEDSEVKTITDFGAFVQYAPGKDGLVHISQIAKTRVNRVEDYLKVGQKVKVKIAEIDSQGRVKLTIKDA